MGRSNATQPVELERVTIETQTDLGRDAVIKISSLLIRSYRKSGELELRVQICLALLLIASVAPTLFAQTAAKKNPRTPQVADLVKPKTDTADAGVVAVPATDEIRSTSEKLSLADVEPARNLFRAGVASIDNGQYKDAIASLEAADKLVPNSRAIYTQLGNAYLGLSDYKNSINAFERAVSLGAASAAIRGALGVAYLKLAKPEKAIHDSINEYWRSIGLDRKHYLSYFGLAAVYSAQSRNEDAIGFLKEAIRLKPDFTEAYLALGDLLSSTGNYKDAIHHFELAIKLNPRSSVALNNLGVAYLRMGKNKEGLESFKRAAALTPNIGEIRLNLARTYLRLKNKQAALTEYILLKSIDSERAKIVYDEIFQGQILNVHN